MGWLQGLVSALIGCARMSIRVVAELRRHRKGEMLDFKAIRDRGRLAKWIEKPVASELSAWSRGSETGRRAMKKCNSRSENLSFSGKL